MRPPLHVRPLSAGRVAALEAQYRRTPAPAERTRCQIILLLHQSLTPPVIAALVRADPATVHRTIHRYEAEGLIGLRTLSGLSTTGQGIRASASTADSRTAFRGSRAARCSAPRAFRAPRIPSALAVYCLTYHLGSCKLRTSHGVARRTP